MRKKRKVFQSANEQFFSKVNFDVDHGCWNWVGSRKNGKLQFCISAHDFPPKVVMARRYAWKEIFNWNLDDGKEIWNVCGNVNCVFPPHQISNTLEDRFWNNVRKGKSCWVWLGHKDSHGYGFISMPEKNKRMSRSHRISWIIHFGEIPDGLDVCHRCDNPSCVNPKHLFLGTHEDNMMDMVEKGRFPRGEFNVHSKLTSQKVIEIISIYKLGKKTQKELSELYGVSKTTVGGIVNKIRWKWMHERIDLGIEKLLSEDVLKDIGLL